MQQSRKRELMISLGIVFGVIAVIALFIAFVVKPCLPCEVKNWDRIQQILEQKRGN